MCARNHRGGGYTLCGNRVVIEHPSAVLLEMTARTRPRGYTMSYQCCGTQELYPFPHFTSCDIILLMGGQFRLLSFVKRTLNHPPFRSQMVSADQNVRVLGIHYMRHRLMSLIG